MLRRELGKWSPSLQAEIKRLIKKKSSLVRGGVVWHGRMHNAIQVAHADDSPMSPQIARQIVGYFL